jgi:hypothetical protein
MSIINVAWVGLSPMYYIGTVCDLDGGYGHQGFNKLVLMDRSLATYPYLPPTGPYEVVGNTHPRDDRGNYFVKP